MKPSPIRVLLVEDSPVALAILTRLLSSSPDVEIVGTARNGLEALELISQLQPMVICTDLHMPKMGGLELTRRVMAEYPRPILVISASVQEEDAENAFQILQAGAIDIFPKPRTGLPSEYEEAKQELINRIKVVAGVSVFTQRYRKSVAPPVTPVLLPSTSSVEKQNSPQPELLIDIRFPRVVAIGASTGGPQAICSILRDLPATFPVPILCVQHIGEGFLQGLVDWLARESALRVTIAESGAVPQAGTVYFPPERHHLQIDAQGRLALSSSPPIAGHCPSVTVLFEAVAAYYRRSAVGILLTGMGRDGAEGLHSMAQAGGVTIVQDEQSCVVFGMPKEAIALGAAQYVLALNDMAPMLLHRIFKL